MQPSPAPLHLRQLKNQAKDLRRACRAGVAEAWARLHEHHPKHPPNSRSEVSLQDAQLVIAREQGYESWPKLVSAAHGAASRPAEMAEFIGCSEGAVRVRRLLRAAATSTAPVLLVGERGTGKRLCARLVHAAGPRAAQPFAQMTCQGSPTLVESQLFGHEPDAFTGARGAHAGLLETTSGGTLLIDGIGALSTSAQAKLQAYLEDGRFRRLGGRIDLTADTRLIASSDVDPRTSVEEGSWREDLHYQLAVLRIDLPPLRQRREDVGELTACLAAQVRGDSCSAPVFSAAALQAMQEYSWPGNVRQLRSVVEGAVLTTTGGQIGPGALHLEMTVDD